jgi:23S rRNA G2445 N2-methylase RlmL
MDIFITVNSGMEQLAAQEVKELIKAKATAHEALVEFKIKSKEELLLLIHRLQSVKRIAINLGKFGSLDKLDFASLKFPWKEVLSAETKLKINVENVKGNDNRLEISRKVIAQLFPILTKEFNSSPIIEMKHPDVEVIIHRSGEEYFIGLDVCGKELNARAYRLFVNHAAFKGDLGYYLIRKSGFKAGEKLLSGFAKDGTVAIEAALYGNELRVTADSKEFSFHKFSLFKEFDFAKFAEETFVQPKTPTVINAFDLGMQSVIAANKNSALAKTKNYVGFHKYGLDELELKFSEGEFDRIIMHVTLKDEANLNEIYYQTLFLLKSGGTLLIIGRKGFELSISNKFKLISEEEIQRGESFHKVWLMEKL